MSRYFAFVITLAALLFVASLDAQESLSRADSRSAATAAEGPIATATLIERGPILDGRLDDAVWSSAVPLSGFIEREPVEGRPAVEDTEIRILYTSDALYIGARMSADPETVRTDITRRDVEGDAEQIAISFDSFLDRRTAYTFAVTAAGSRIDYLHPADYEGRRDYSFDPVWEAEVELTADGWTAEMRIPFTQLRFNPSDEQDWGINVRRERPALQQESLWILVRRDESGWASRMGRLTGLRGIRPGRRVEFQPYVASAGTVARGVDAADPFRSSREASVRAGGDLKVGIGPNLTLDATINPDFGQVEADPAVVNLSAFEVFYQEQRPFFTEGARLFEWGNMFYSRRIGAPPHGSPDEDYVEPIENTTILGAAKVTGRLPSGMSIGVLGALTGQENAEVYDLEANRFGGEVVEPLTGYGVARVEQQYGSEGSTVGAILTGVQRRVGSGSELGNLLHTSAVTGGFDGRFRWAGGDYDLNWRFGFSHIAGSAESIERQQRVSRRYFQRPDADYVEVDPGRTALSGYVIGLGHSRTGASHWLWDIDAWAESPGYEPNDLGSLGRTDGLGGFAGLHYRETDPGPVFRRYRLSLLGDSEWNYGGDHTVSNSTAQFDVEFTNYWRVIGGVDYSPQVQSPTLTRGGPLMKDGGSLGPFLFIESPRGGLLGASIDGYIRDIPAGGSDASLQTSLSYRPAPNISFAIEPRYERRVDPLQYVATRTGGTATTFGSRYVFGKIDRTDLSTQLRADYAAGPDLTLEAYLEPFVSSGSYSGFGELSAARTNDLQTYGEESSTIRRTDSGYAITDRGQAFSIPDPDYHVRSFRSNLVMRWEWRRGSTLFLVWQQDRSGLGRLGERAAPSDLLESLSEPGDHFFALKATYWIPW